jgi:exopolysaccharide production protein ExoZ
VLDWLKRTFEFDNENARLISMEGLRGLAVTLVFLVHYTTLARPWIAAQSLSGDIIEMLHSVGNTGVDLFFVLSGYLIYGTLIEKHKPFSRYFMRRLERIYPTFLVVTLLYLVLSIAFPAESKIPKGTGTGALFVLQNLIFMPGLFSIPAINTVTWSLSYEMFYYLIIPVVIPLLGLRSWSRDNRIKFFVVALFVLAILFWKFGGPVRMGMFIAGIVLYELVTKGVRLKDENGLGLVALALGIMTVWVLHGKGVSLQVVLLCVFFGYGCFTCFCVEERARGVTRSVFCWRPLRWLGNMSYSYYLIHGLTIKFFFLVLAKIFPPLADQAMAIWALLPIAFVMTLIVSAVLFIAVEKPYSLIPGALIGRFTKPKQA